MSGTLRRFQMTLVPVNEDGSIPERWSEREGLPKVSKAEPVDEATARLLALAAANRVRSVCLFLRKVAEVLPLPTDREAMYDDRVPPDVATNMEGAIDLVIEASLEPAIRHLNDAASATSEDLRRDFEERHRRYREERRQRP